MTREEKARRLVESLKPLQLRGEKFPCPRCGRDSMKTEQPATNALSRRADVYICDACGTEEALDDLKGTPRLLTEWAMPQGFMGEKRGRNLNGTSRSQEGGE